jgi:alginate O-acetyltransferase complex protein AlgI
MLFNSFEFLFFLPLVTVIYFLLTHKLRIYFLLAASCIFYCYFIPIYLLLLVFIILLDYFIAIKIEQSTSHKKQFLLCSIIGNIGILCIFKYYNFFISNFNEIFDSSGPLLKIILPIGLSFHTFQAMAYTIEIYKGKIKAEKDLSIYALYVLFYPQLVAGPIERPQNLIPQFHERKFFSSQNLLDGARLILWGYFKKLVIADNISLIVNNVYENPLDFKWYIVLIAIFLFSIQIYCDFSGYTDIARGVAKIMGFELMINFNRPLLSSSLQKFWHRWHISLSTWFRDYFYIPLGGNKKGYVTKIILLSLTFILSGFWHGAGWNFITWGVVHAFFLIIALSIKSKKIRKHNILIKIFKTIGINIIVAYAFVFFRNDSINKAMDIILSSINLKNNMQFLALKNQLPAIGNYTAIVILFSIVLMFIYEYFSDASLTVMNKYPKIDIIWFCCIFIFIVFWGVFTNEAFIYFQF